MEQLRFDFLNNTLDCDFILCNCKDKHYGLIDSNNNLFYYTHDKLDKKYYEKLGYKIYEA